MKKSRIANLGDKEKKGPSMKASKGKEGACWGESVLPEGKGFLADLICPECGSKMIPQGCRDGVWPICGFSNCQ